MLKSILTKYQTTGTTKEFFINGKLALMAVTLEHDEKCNNKHNTFSITAEIYEQYYQNDKMVKLSNGKKAWLNAAGCLHEEIIKVFPELEYLIKWHLTSTEGPLHYIANTLYWMRCGNLKNARKSAVWLDAKMEDITKDNLIKRLPALLKAFKKDIESIGFVY